MNALVEINLLRKAAKAAGIAGYNKMKLIELRELGLSIEEPTKVREEDPFDDIDPETEGDHLADTTLKGQAQAITATREAWLLAAVELLRPMFAQVGAVVPDMRISVGFPSTSVRKRIGECWHSPEGQIPQIFVSPVLDNIIDVLAVVIHEAIHACLGEGFGHGKEFRALATSVGLEGKMTATTPSETLVGQLKEIIDELGDYPHVKLTLGTAKKQTTRMLKVQCDNLGCGFIFRTTAKWIATFDGCEWLCPCGGNMVPEVKEESEDGETETGIRAQQDHPWTKPSQPHTEESKVMEEIGE
jgi:hypothetical protein